MHRAHVCGRRAQHHRFLRWPPRSQPRGEQELPLMTTKSLNIGLIGSGFMGKAHVFGFTSAPRVFDLPFDLVLHTVADITEDAAARAGRTLGFRKHTGDWRGL